MTGRSLRQLIWRWPSAIVQNQQADVSRLARCTVRAKFCIQSTPRWYCTPCRYHRGAGGIRTHAGIGCTPARQRSSAEKDSAGGQRSDRRSDQRRWGMGRWTLLNVAATGAAAALLGEALRKPAQCRKLQGDQRLGDRHKGPCFQCTSAIDRDARCTDGCCGCS